MTTTSPDIDLAELIADTEGEIVRLVQDRDPSTHGLYEMVRYHLALDGSGASGGKRMRPLLGLLAYASIAGEHRGRCRAPRPSSSGTTSRWSTTTSRTATSSVATGRPCGRSTGSRRRSTPATRSSACRGSRSIA
jgi:geranylgeranyl pyrophosphate synthase